MKVFVVLALLLAVAFAEPPVYGAPKPQQQQQQQQQQQRYFFARQQASTASPAPYSPSGWKPEGPAFNLPEPARQSQGVQVDNSYGVPQEPHQQQELPNNQYIPPQAKVASYRQQTQTNAALKINQFNRFEKQTQARAPRPHEQYNLPQTQYGVPELTTDFPDSNEFDEPTTVVGLPEVQSEPLDSRGEFDDEVESAGQGRQHQQPQQQERGQYYVALPDGRLQRVRYVSRQDMEAMRYFAKIRAENVEPLRGPIYAYAPLQKLEVAPGTLQVAPVTPLDSGVGNRLTVTAVEAKPQKLVAPKVDIKPLAQLQYQHDNQVQVAPLSSGYAAYTEYRAPANLAEDSFILAFP